MTQFENLKVSPFIFLIVIIKLQHFKIFEIDHMNKISNYFSDSFKELTEKVTWPTWEQLQQSTMIVLAATLLITGVVAVMDLIASGGLNFIYKLF